MRLVERHFQRQHPQQSKKQKFRCVRCTALGDRKESTYYCPSCKVALCLFPCFEIYHTKRDITSQLEEEEEYIESSEEYSSSSDSSSADSESES